jgi:hypothetical protein
MSGKSVKDAVMHRSPAQMFAVVVGVVLIVVGIVGMITNASFATGNELSAEKFLFMDVNGWSNVLYLVTGAVLVVGSLNAARAKLVSAIVGGFYLLLTVWSLLDSSILGLLPVNDMTAILYAAIGVIGLTVGLGPDRADTTG